MTISLSLTDPDTSATVTVDLTDNNTSVMAVINNPFYVIPTPVDDSGASGASPTPNEFIIDISMLSTQFMLTFDLKDGYGSNWSSSASTKFEKLMFMARIGVKNQKNIIFTWGNLVTTVKIGGFRAGTEPGKKAFMPGCSLTLQMAKDL